MKKWLIDIRPDPKSKWAQTFAERLAALALITPLAVDEDPTEDADLNEDDEGKVQDRQVRCPLPAGNAC